MGIVPEETPTEEEPMSTRSREALRAIMSSTVLVASVLAAALWVSPAAADTLEPLTAVLNGAQETPPEASPSTGVAFLTFNQDNSNLCYAISYTPLSGTEFLAHFHGPAKKGDVAGPGVASPVLHNITGGSPPGPSPLGSPKNGCALVRDQPPHKGMTGGPSDITINTQGPP